MHGPGLQLSCCHITLPPGLPALCRGPSGNAEAKYQEISDTEKPHFPEGDQSVSDKVGACTMCLLWEGWRGGRWCDRRLAVTACGCTLRLEFPFQLSGSPAHCWHCSLLAIPPLAPPWPTAHPPLHRLPQFPSMHEAASLQSNTPEGQMAESERIRCGATGSELAPCGAMHGWWVAHRVWRMGSLRNVDTRRPCHMPAV